MAGYGDTALELAFKETMNKAQQNLYIRKQKSKDRGFLQRSKLGRQL